jgi:uncharacterized protein with PhoU and TrkA domain
MPINVHKCQCAACLADHQSEEWKIHHQMNVLLSRLNEQQRRWYVALESIKIGHGGDRQLSEITGLDVETIRRGRRELDADLETRPTEGTRIAGAGQPAVEKKSHRSRRR